MTTAHVPETSVPHPPDVDTNQSTVAILTNVPLISAILYTDATTTTLNVTITMSALVTSVIQEKVVYIPLQNASAMMVTHVPMTNVILILDVSIW
jgi:hypothetical protein